MEMKKSLKMKNKEKIDYRVNMKKIDYRNNEQMKQQIKENNKEIDQLLKENNKKNNKRIECLRFASEFLDLTLLLNGARKPGKPFRSK